MNASLAPARPALRYHGSKYLLSPWIISHFGPHRVYTEVYGGGASVLLRKPRSYGEVINDLDSEIINYFRVLRDRTQAAELERLLRLTPFARDEFTVSYEKTADPVEQARRTVVRSFMGFASTLTGPWQTGFRSNNLNAGAHPAASWVTYADVLPVLTARLQGVVIENRPALDVLRQYDGPDVQHYIDPPYPLSTRGKWGGKGYRYEMTDDQHRELAATLRTLAGMVVLSGYPCALYDQELYPDWRRVTRQALADGAEPRLEVLWLNAAAARNLPVVPAQYSMWEQA